MRLTVRGATTFDVEVGADTSLADVHSRVAAVTGVPKGQLRLTRLGGVGVGRLWWGRQAVGSVLEDGALLEAHVRLRGGSFENEPMYKEYWDRHSVGGTMDATQIVKAFAQMKRGPQELWCCCDVSVGDDCRKLKSVVDSTNHDRLATTLMNRVVTTDRVNESQFADIFELASMPFIPKRQIFEEGFDSIKAKLRHFLAIRRRRKKQQQNPAEVYYRSDTKVLARARPDACRRAMGVFHPWNACFSACLVPPTSVGVVVMPVAVALSGYPVNYYLARPCFLYLSAQARSLTLRKSTIVFRNTGHPGYVECSGPLGFCLPVTCLCSALAYTCMDDACCSCCLVDEDNASIPPLYTFWTYGLPHAFSPECCGPKRPETTLIPLDIVRDAIVIDRRCCCGNPHQAELAGTSTLAIVGPNDTILAILDTVPHPDAIAFVDAVKASLQRNVPRSMDDATAAAFAQYQQMSWVGLYDAIHSTALPEKTPHVDLVTTSQPRHHPDPTTTATTPPLQDQRS